MDLPRVSSGIIGLDEKIRGGIPAGSSILVYGPPKVGKTIFASQFFAAGLQAQETGLYIMTDFSVDQLRQSMLSMDIMQVMQQEQNGFVYYIDLFSIRSGSVQNTNIISNVSPAALSNLMISLSDAHRFLSTQSMNMRTIFDTPAALAEDHMQVMPTFLRTFIAKSKAAGSTTLFTYCEGAFDSRMETLFKSLVDGTIHLSADGKLTVESMIATPRPPEMTFQITDNGIVVQ